MISERGLLTEFDDYLLARVCQIYCDCEKVRGILLGDLFLWFVGLSLNCGDDFLFFLIEVNFALDYCFVVESCSDQESYFGDTSSVFGNEIKIDQRGAI